MALEYISYQTSHVLDSKLRNFAKHHVAQGEKILVGKEAKKIRIYSLIAELKLKLELGYQKFIMVYIMDNNPERT